jgi:hypothetical protein
MGLGLALKAGFRLGHPLTYYNNYYTWARRDLSEGLFCLSVL